MHKEVQEEGPESWQRRKDQQQGTHVGARIQGQPQVSLLQRHSNRTRACWLNTTAAPAGHFDFSHSRQSLRMRARPEVRRAPRSGSRESATVEPIFAFTHHASPPPERAAETRPGPAAVRRCSRRQCHRRPLAAATGRGWGSRPPPHPAGCCPSSTAEPADAQERHWRHQERLCWNEEMAGSRLRPSCSA